MRIPVFWIVAAAFLVLIVAVNRLVAIDFYILMIGAVLQLMILGTAWNILGGYCGYINFGNSAFIGIGAYASAVIAKTQFLPFPSHLFVGAIVAGVLGLLLGVMTMRLRGIYFAIASLAVAVILETCIHNWEYVGGSRGVVVSPIKFDTFVGDYSRILLLLSATLLVVAVAIARYVHISWIGRGLQAIRDDELAAQCSGVPTLGLKLAAAAVSGGLMGAAGSLFPLYNNFLEPTAIFNLDYAMLPLAVALIGGTGHWFGPLLGALLFGGIRQFVVVHIGSEVATLLIGILLVVFVVAAPHGIIGPLLRAFHKRRRTS